MSEVIELAEKLRNEGDKILAFFGNLAEEHWKQDVYTEGSIWTIRHVLAHFVTSERGLLKLFEQIRQGGTGAADDFSIDRYNAAMQERMQAMTPGQLLEQYREVRTGTVAWVSGLQQAELDISGRHPFLGQTVLREMIKMLYVHNQIHSRDIKRALTPEAAPRP